MRPEHPNDEARERARDLMPQILLTVLSIIQALALEALWSSVLESPHLWAGGLAAWIGWLQVVAVFQGIVVMWLFYVSLVLRFHWTPTVRDSVVPFLLGVMEFVLAELLAPGWMHVWLYLLAGIFLGASWTSFLILSLAARDPANADTFRRTPLRVRISLAPAVVFIAILVVAGAAVQAVGPDGGVALAAVVAANAVLAAQAAVIRHYWNLWLEPDRVGPSAGGDD